MEEYPVLTKRERRILARQQKTEEREGAQRRSRMARIVIALLVIALLAGGAYFIWREATKPLPGEAIADLGREHVPEGTPVEYNSNPPTSGPHFANWAKAGVYEELIADGFLVHSLEHGYVVLSYNCSAISNFQFPISNEATESGEEQSPWESQECQEMKDSLRSVFEKKGQKKLIVVPRPDLDVPVALTAWTRIQKLDSFDEQAISNFIDSFRDRGPEKTME